jgi:hypothetical protein
MRNVAATLTQKQQRFVAEYMVDGNGSRAAIAAGYGHAGARVRAYRLTRDNAAVMAEIRARQSTDRERLDLDRAAVIRGIMAGIELAKERQEPAAMIPGWAELVRLMGFYPTTRSHVEVSAVAPTADLGRFEAMSDAELLAMMAGRAEQGPLRIGRGVVEAGGDQIHNCPHARER